MKAGMRTPKMRMASGRMGRRYGSRQTSVYTARKDNVWLVRRQESSRVTRTWNLNITPMRALKRRKLFDMVVMLNPGRSEYAGMLSSGVSVSCTWPSSGGITCCRSLMNRVSKVSSSTSKIIEESVAMDVNTDTRVTMKNILL